MLNVAADGSMQRPLKNNKLFIKAVVQNTTVDHNAYTSYPGLKVEKSTENWHMLTQFKTILSKLQIILCHHMAGMTPADLCEGEEGGFFFYF